VSNAGKTRIGELADKIALELVFAEPGRDSGLLPINSFLTEIENDPGFAALPEEVRKAVILCRHWVDAAFDAGGLPKETLERLGAWCCWMREAASAIEQGATPPLLPQKLSSKLAEPVRAAPPPVLEGSEAEEAIPLDVNTNADLLREFVEEANEHLQRIELDALALEKNPADADTLNSLFRAFHTVKGGSGFLNLLPMNRLAHELEALLDLTRQGKLQARRPVINVILSGRDTLRQFVSEIEKRLTDSSLQTPVLVPIRPVLAQVAAALKPGSEEDPAEGAAQPQPAKAPDVIPAAESGEAPGQSNGASRGPISGSVKVDTAKLDSLIDLVGELVIAQSLVLQGSNLRSDDSQQLSRNVVHLSRVTNDLQRTAMSLRMIPIRATFQKMSRLVRDVAAKSGKLVELNITGEDTELDRNLIEQINDPLIHMLRNAVDHGIEKPAAREAKGKPSKGVLHLRAFHQGGNVVIEVADDGAGLNRERLLAKAIERGLVAKDAQLSEQEIYALIFAPGFSTAEKVTDISGRGVGMDVVRRNIQKLRGNIEIWSAEGKGSRFSIHLPLTLAIIDGLIFSVGSERFILPALSVRESFRPEPQMISTVHGRAEMVSVRGQFSPLVRLYERFGLQPETTDPGKAIIVVVESNNRVCGLLVDRLLGKQEVVIKGLGEALKRSRAIAGAAILGDGRVGLILDVNGLVPASEDHLSQNAFRC
jgi:two-component system chemotaxis sensor kinase CheA